MARTLIVAEKPSVGRDIARVLGARGAENGALASAEYVVTWAVGHLVTFVEPDELDARYKKWRMDDLPILPAELPLKVLPRTREQFASVKKWMNSRDIADVVCATDAGREGELIFRLIYRMAGCKKPVRRLFISSLTDEAIRAGFAALKPDAEYDGLYQSALLRAKADWLVGMNASRAFSLRCDARLSVGRVQTPTLSLIVRRQREIEAFKPETFFTLTADFGDYSGVWARGDGDGAGADGVSADAGGASASVPPDAGDASGARVSRIPTRAAAEEIAARVAGGTGVVASASAVEKRDMPPYLFDLTSLQRACNARFGFTAQKTLAVAQRLYESYKYITYPRTDSRCLPEDMRGKAGDVLRTLPAPYAAYSARVADSARTGLKRVFDNGKISDHHAIIPTKGALDLNKLPPDERRVMDAVIRRMIEAFYPPCVYDALRVRTDVGADRFLSRGRAVKQAGWREVEDGLSGGAGGADDGRDADGGADPRDVSGDAVPARKPRTARADARSKSDAREEDAPLPPLSVGDTRQVRGTRDKEDTTRPPAPLNDATLLSAMENAGRDIDDESLRDAMKGSGLGTPATRAAIIERLVEVGYVRRRGKALIATDKGMALIALAPPEIASAETTGRWEKALYAIARQKHGDEALGARFSEGIERMTRFLVQFARALRDEGQFPQDEAKRGRAANSAGSSASVESPPAKKRAARKKSGAAGAADGAGGTTGSAVNADSTPSAIPAPAKKRRRSSEKAAVSASRSPAAPSDVAAAPRPAAPPDALPCPVCGEGHVTENERAFGCSRWREGCAFTLWKDALTRGGGPALTERLVRMLLSDGRVRGSTGIVTLTRGEQGALEFRAKDADETAPPAARAPILYRKR